MKQIPKVPKEFRKVKQNSNQRLLIWLSLFKKYEKENELAVHASKVEIMDFVGEEKTPEKFIIEYRIHINGKKTNYGIHFYFEPFNVSTAVLVDYRPNDEEPASFKIKATPLCKWAIYSTNEGKNSFDATWEFSYYLLLQCMDFFAHYGEVEQ